MKINKSTKGCNNSNKEIFSNRTDQYSDKVALDKFYTKDLLDN